MIDAVRQEPERRDQDQGERERPKAQPERQPAGQEPARASLITVVWIEQDVDPIATLALCADPDLGLTLCLDGPVPSIACAFA